MRRKVRCPRRNRFAPMTDRSKTTYTEGGARHARQAHIPPPAPTSGFLAPAASMSLMGSTQAWYIQKLIHAYDWYLANRTPFEMLGLFLAVLGTLFAVFSIRDGRKLTTELRSVFDHLTTKEIGAFPGYMA